MVKAVFLIPVLILSLLLCPLHCMGAFTGVGTDASVAEAGCTCCGHHAAGDEAPSESPVGQQGNGVCGNCLCHGAIAVADSVDDLLAIDVAAWNALAFFSPTIEAENRQLHNSFCNVAETRLAPHCSVRIILQSLLL